MQEGFHQEREIYRIQFHRGSLARVRIEADYPRWKLVKTNKGLGDPRAAFGVVAIRG